MRRSQVLIAIVLLAAMLAACTPPQTGTPARAPEGITTPVKATKQGWEAEWDKAVQEAKKEGKISAYANWPPETQTAIRKAVKEKFGLEIEFTPGGGSEHTVKIVSERRAGLYLVDVISQGASYILSDMKPAGIVASVEPMLILPEVTDAKAWTGGNPFLDRDKLVIPFSASFNSYLGYNTELVKKGEIGSYQDLLDPKWKGKIVMRDPTGPGSGNAWVGFLTTLWGLDKTKDYLRQFVKQEPVLSRDLRLIAESVAKGKYSLAVGPYPPGWLELEQLGAPVTLGRVKDGLSVTAGGGCLSLPSGQLPHPNAAKVFINWLLTKEGQALFSEVYLRPSARLDVPPPKDYPGLLPLPGEKVVPSTEEGVLLDTQLFQVAKEIFAPLMK
ncbi:MAG: extracellular solute-binding protein [Chloroflexi bacterium]|nr:extracellular solute-binding protein [Chloroflexota bacterium]